MSGAPDSGPDSDAFAARDASADAVRAYGGRFSADGRTLAQVRAQAAYEIYRAVAQDAIEGAVASLRDLGARHGAVYVGFPGSDDPDDSSLLSAYPGFYDADGRELDWNEEPEIQNGPEYDAWQGADRDEPVVERLAPDVRSDPQLGEISTRTDHAYIFRCTPVMRDA